MVKRDKSVNKILVILMALARQTYVWDWMMHSRVTSARLKRTLLKMRVIIKKTDGQFRIWLLVAAWCVEWKEPMVLAPHILA
jgi:hypothetical protein